MLDKKISTSLLGFCLPVGRLRSKALSPSLCFSGLCVKGIPRALVHLQATCDSQSEHEEMFTYLFLVMAMRPCFFVIVERTVLT